MSIIPGLIVGIFAYINFFGKPTAYSYCRFAYSYKNRASKRVTGHGRYSCSWNKT